jgi:succinate dehydrogenase/fumarate reductase flavoprotein subunit
MKIPVKWDREADVVVCGFGGSGAVAAVTAFDQGASVLVLEKQSFGGGDANTVAGPPFVLKVVNKEKALAYLRWCTGGRTEDEVLLANMDILSEVPDYICKLKIPIKNEPYQVVAYGEYFNAPGYGGLGQVIMLDKVGGGPEFFNYQAKLARERGIEVLYNTPASRLVQNPENDEIMGVIAVMDGKEIAVKAKKATIIATGGFAFNKEMVKQYMTPVPICWMGDPAMTGDGITMAQQVGAQLWHMDSCCGPMFWGMEDENHHVYATYEYLLPITVYGKKGSGSYIWVNKYGKRFDAECSKSFGVNDVHRMRARTHWFAFDPQGTAEMKHIPVYQIFDEKVRSAGGLFCRLLNPRTPNFSEGLEEEIKKGWIIKADTIEDLAQKCKFKAIEGVTRAGNLPPEALKQTIERWNTLAREGKDPEFGRDAAMTPLDTPPYYAWGPLFPTFTSTFGGPKHDGRQRVLDAFGKPIPRLYAIGDCGSLNAHMYGFWGGPHMLTSGLIAGNQAAQEIPRCGERKEIRDIKQNNILHQQQDLSGHSRKKETKKAKASKVETVCNLCAITCELIVTFDDSGSVVSLTGDQCESGKVFIEQNRAVLLAGNS